MTSEATELSLEDALGVVVELQQERRMEAAVQLCQRILDAVPVEKVPARQRINPGTQKRQFLTTEILHWLPSLKPADSYALIAVTMEDLYPDEKWNFVFGQARLMGGVGVFSFARYDPDFPLLAR